MPYVKKRELVTGDLVFTGHGHHEEYARWLACCGRSAQEIAARCGRRVSVSTIRLWAGRELDQYRRFREAVLDSDPLFRDVLALGLSKRKPFFSIADETLGPILERIRQLRNHYVETWEMRDRVVLDAIAECGIPWQAEHWPAVFLARARYLVDNGLLRFCERCGGRFVAKRSDTRSRFCSTACRVEAWRAKEASEDSVTHNYASRSTTPKYEAHLTSAVAKVFEFRLGLGDDTMTGNALATGLLHVVMCQAEFQAEMRDELAGVKAMLSANPTDGEVREAV